MIIKKIYFKLKKIIKYNLINFYLSNAIPVIKNQLNNVNKPLCYQPLYFVGNGDFIIGENCFFGYPVGMGFRHGYCELQIRNKKGKIIIGNNVKVNNNFSVCSYNEVIINDNCLIGANVNIRDFEAHNINPQKRHILGEIGKIKIGKNVWIGNNVSILKNSEIGENSIVAMGAVVTGKFPANVVIGGVPAKIIKEIDVS